jgi:hypothetical protein
MHEYPRRRREVAHGAVLALRPLLRYDARRQAYVLRVVGNRTGPVLRSRRDWRHPVQRTTRAS